MLGVISQFETEIRSERQMDGIKKAKERGVRFGAKKKLPPEQVVELRQRRHDGVLIKDLMKEYGISKVSVYQFWLRKFKRDFLYSLQMIYNYVSREVSNDVLESK